MSTFFIDRPVLAWVIAILIMLAGGLTASQLPISQYPEVAPPAVAITANYPGASADTVENSVVQIIETNLTGIDNVEYFSSVSDSAGTATITVTFTAGTDADIAQVQVQNKLQSALPLLPQEVQRQGIRVSKTASGFLLVPAFVSSDGSMSTIDISDFVSTTVQDPLSRLGGVGQVQLFGAPYAMRIWLDAEKMAAYSLTATDIVNAIRSQNAQIAAGELGGLPAVEGQQLNASIVVQSRFNNAEQFRNILLRVNPNGARILLGDVAEVELGGENYAYTIEFNRLPAVGMAISLASGANALQTAEDVRARIDELKPFFPEGLEVYYPYDTTPFIEISIDEVVKTLIEAIILVFLVMLLFLQNFRATLITTVAIPVVLLGTFGLMAMFGFTINTLTMFGLVLAIGLLVDDAIVVVENVERVMTEEHLSPREATRKSMKQITGALIGIAMVLSAVFVPMAFFGGSTGIIYRQFSVTMVSAMVLSVIVALVLTPALCATILKPHDPNRKENRFFAWFNRNFKRATEGYQRATSYILRRTIRFLAIYAALLCVLVFGLFNLPGSFLPEEDQGTLFVQMTLPAGATAERADRVMNQIEDYFFENEAENVDSAFSVIGFSFAGGGQNNGTMFVRLKDWKERTRPDQSVQAIAQRAGGALWQIRDAMVFPFVPPAITELGTSSGFNFQLEDLNGAGHDALIAARNQLLGMAAQDSRLANVRPNGQEDAPVFKVDVDQQAAAALGVSMTDVSNTLGVGLAPSYVDDFILNGRVKRVIVQSRPENRMLPEDINDWYVRNRSGEMVPFSAFSVGRWEYASPRLERYNGFPSVNIQGEAAPGLSSGDAMEAMEELAGQLPEGFGFEWTGMSLQEQQSGSQAPLLYALSLIVVFLSLAALYESWSVPAAVMLVVPLGILGAVLFAISRGLSNDIYFQVGLLTTVGLSAKNAILIVEFAKSLFESGLSLWDSIMEAIRMRLRPIIMTSMAFSLAVLPLVLASGAGSGGQIAIGTAVFGGMISATLLAIFFVPLFFALVFRARGQDAEASSS